jgi:hypothetical protein
VYEDENSTADAAFLSTGDAAGCWVWVGARLSTEGRIDATQRYTDLTWDERRKRLAEEELSWLAAQWEPPAPGNRFEVRFAIDPDTEKVRTALLLRVLAATPDEAQRIARHRLDRATAVHGALPPHCGARPIESETELLAWLTYPAQAGSLIELRKHLSAGQIRRGGTSLRHAVCHGFFDGGGAAWDAWWRRFAALKFRAALCVGFEPYDADLPAFRDMLDRRTRELESLAREGTPSPLNPYAVPADPAAEVAAPGYRRALMRYSGRCFRIRIALVSEEPVPQTLVEALVRTVSGVTGAVRPVEVVGSEFAQAMHEQHALGAPWLPATFQQGLPYELDLMDQLLHSMADVSEAGSVLSLPVHWPGMPPVFDRNGNPLITA